MSMACLKRLFFCCRILPAMGPAVGCGVQGRREIAESFEPVSWPEHTNAIELQRHQTR